MKKKIAGAALGLTLALALGLGATQLYASAQAAKADEAKKVCPASACPTEAKSSCPMGGSSQT